MYNITCCNYVFLDCVAPAFNKAFSLYFMIIFIYFYCKSLCLLTSLVLPWCSKITTQTLPSNTMSYLNQGFQKNSCKNS